MEYSHNRLYSNENKWTLGIFSKKDKSHEHQAGKAQDAFTLLLRTAIVKTVLLGGKKYKENNGGLENGRCLFRKGHMIFD